MPERAAAPAPVLHVSRPSTWLVWHDYLLRPGVRVLDLACGEGRHGIAAARRGAMVTAIDRDAGKLDIGREVASKLGVSVDWRCVDLEATWPDLGQYDLVFLFNYLDRSHARDVVERVAPGGTLVMETFLEWQRRLGWGPTDDAHLLRPGEIAKLVEPLHVVHGREVFEPVDAGRHRAVASVVAERR
jgi:2-polyprenyl-3-methyl-5-hydroxy-6-metoxy-1,4-benzoquinol methylase